MIRQQPRQSTAPSPQQAQGTLDGRRGAGQVASPYLTSREALGYLRLPSLSSLYSHIRENRLPVCRVGGALRFDTRELDAWVRGFDSALEQKRSLVAVRKVG